MQINNSSVPKRTDRDASLVETQTSHLTCQSNRGSQAVEEPGLYHPWLKPEVQWIRTEPDHWILRNPSTVHLIEISNADYRFVRYLGKQPLPELATSYRQSHPDRPEAWQELLGLLAQNGMLVGTEPAKSPKRKWHILQLLSFLVPLGNPDAWLERHLPAISFIYTQSFAIFLVQFLLLSIGVAFFQRQELLATGYELWQRYDIALLLPFAGMTFGVITLHELAHAFTLKYYGGKVPEMGLLFIYLIPGAYTDIRDSMALKRGPRALVAAAGILCQVVLWAIGWLLWNLFAQTTLAATGAYMLMVASVATILLNLNPLNKFDGYYILEASTGMNRLRERAFGCYRAWVSGQPSWEKPENQRFFALYAPLCLLYMLWVMLHLLPLLGKAVTWNLTVMLSTLAIVVVWAVYFYWPSSKSRS
jgi:putative peptide zinc metalloprotease protein